jgi:small subunit ribosomal protein S5
LTGGTIAHDVAAKLGSARVLLKPASEGRGLIAGGAVRAVVDLLGVRDVVSKSLGASNPLNVARVTIEALKQLPRAKAVVVAEPVVAPVASPKAEEVAPIVSEK